MGGNNKIAPPNRFARTLFLEKSLVLGRKWFFFGGESIEGAPKMVLAQFHVFSQYQK